VIAQLALQFKPYGFAMSAPVFEYLDDYETLQQEIRQDLAHGLSVRPRFIRIRCRRSKMPTGSNARTTKWRWSMSDSAAPAVFRMHDAMCEVATHRHWSDEIIARYGCYGTRERVPLPIIKKPFCKQGSSSTGGIHV